MVIWISSNACRMGCSCRTFREKKNSDAARSGGRIAQNETAIMAGNNRIMIFGPKSDGTYVVEFRTAAGETLAISIPASEAAVVRYFQERMPYGLFVPDLQEPK